MNQLAHNNMEELDLKTKVQGFTLLELIVVIAIAAILVTLGVPSFLETIRNNRLIAQANGLVSDLNFARTESVKRGVRVTLCRSVNGTACNTEVANNKIWEQGWVIFAETVNTNGQVDAGEPILRVTDQLPAELTLRTDGVFGLYAQYLPSGRRLGSGTAGNDAFRLCDPRGASKAKSIEVQATGRIKIEEGTSTCP